MILFSLERGFYNYKLTSTSFNHIIPTLLNLFFDDSPDHNAMGPDTPQKKSDIGLHKNVMKNDLISQAEVGTLNPPPTSASLVSEPRASRVRIFGTLQTDDNLG